jgi:hypothetical protein
MAKIGRFTQAQLHFAIRRALIAQAGEVIVFATTTRRHAWHIIWPYVVEAAKENGWELLSNMRVKTPNGAFLLILETDNRERLRGQSFDRVIFDENVPPEAEQLIRLATRPHG